MKLKHETHHNEHKELNVKTRIAEFSQKARLINNGKSHRNLSFAVFSLCPSCRCGLN